MSLIPCPRVVTGEKPDAPLDRRWEARFANGRRLLPIVFFARTRQRAEAVAVAWWAARQAERAEAAAAAAARAEDRRRRTFA